MWEVAGNKLAEVPGNPANRGQCREKGDPWDGDGWTMEAGIAWNNRVEGLGLREIEQKSVMPWLA